MSEQTESSIPVKPVFLFADSQVMFWHGPQGLILERVRQLALDGQPGKEKIKAAYIGASNGDKKEYYEIFLAALSQVGIDAGDCMMIKSKPSKKAKAFLDEAGLVLLAGGDVEQGWNIMNGNGVREQVVQRYHDGAVLLGVSAGAVQLGSRGWIEGADEYTPDNIFATFQLVPFMIDVHDEERHWERLNLMVQNGDEHCRGFGIPSGGGAVFHPDWSMEAIRHTLAEYSLFPEGVKHSMILPPGPDGEEGQEQQE